MHSATRNQPQTLLFPYCTKLSHERCIDPGRALQLRARLGAQRSSSRARRHNSYSDMSMATPNSKWRLVFFCGMMGTLASRRLHPHASAKRLRAAQLDTLGIEPRASRMLSGCDTTTPRAHEHHTAVVSILHQAQSRALHRPRARSAAACTTGGSEKQLSGPTS